jgi:SynChlorMet cassette radical SAM/SPASM protein ScmF
MKYNRNEKDTLKPKIERQLKRIYFYLTSGCNLACRHCWLSPKLHTINDHQPVLSVESFQSIIEQGNKLGLSGVKLTGGEPLMHPQIREILNIVKEHKLSLGIETNGVLCTPEIADLISSAKNATIAVSLDGANAETHEWSRGIEGCFQATIKGIRNLSTAGINPQIIFTVMKYNYGQLEELVDFAASLGVNSIKFNTVQPTGRGEQLNAKGDGLPVEEILKLEQWVSDTLSKKTGIKLYFDLPPAFLRLSKMFGSNGDGCGTCGIRDILGVLADGSYALCGIGSHIPQLVFGHVSKDLLEDIWRENKILQEIREGIPGRFEGICGICALKGLCSASCIAQNYYRSKSLWSSFWFCEEAFEKNLFPQTRITATL